MAETFEMIAVQRRSLADVFDGFGDEQWATPSLCAGWTVRDVGGHLTMAFDVSMPSFAIRVLKAGGNYNKAADRYAREAATAPPSTLTATLRSNAENHFTPPGLGPEAPLAEVIVHGLDVGLPTGHKPALPADAANSALDFLVSPKATRGFVPKGMVPGLRFETTDTGWKAGSGPSVTGAAEAVILALTGRRAGLEGLDGEGLTELRRRLA